MILISIAIIVGVCVVAAGALLYLAYIAGEFEH